MNRTVAADFFQLLSLPGTLLFVVLQSNAAFTNSDTQRRKKSLQEMNAGNSAMFHLQPLTASTDRKGPLQHISSCVSLDLTVFALSSWVSCQPRGSGFDIKLIASVTQLLWNVDTGDLPHTMPLLYSSNYRKPGDFRKVILFSVCFGFLEGKKNTVYKKRTL